MKLMKLIPGVLLAALALLSACARVSPVPPTPTNDPRPVLTGAAQTAEARLTQMVASIPTETPVPPTPTLAPTPTVALTPDAPPAATVETPSAAVTPTQRPPSQGGTDNAFLASETIPDGSRLTAGASFTKSWRLLNSGSSTWGRGYELVHVSEQLFGAKSPTALTIDVPSNQMADISVEMVAPTTPGTYRGYWRMRNATGVFFGDLIWVEIVVVGSGTPASTAAATPATTPAPTQGTPAPAAVSNVTVSIETPTVTAACPYTYGINASFTLSQPATVTYQLEAGSSTPGFQFNLPGAQTLSFPAGTHQLSFSLSMSNSVGGWIRLHITAPQDVVSNEAAFSLTCQ
jgi:hypothetical protein